MMTVEVTEIETTTPEATTTEKEKVKAKANLKHDLVIGIARSVMICSLPRIPSVGSAVLQSLRKTDATTETIDTETTGIETTGIETTDIETIDIETTDIETIEVVARARGGITTTATMAGKITEAIKVASTIERRMMTVITTVTGMTEGAVTTSNTEGAEMSGARRGREARGRGGGCAWEIGRAHV